MTNTILFSLQFSLSLDEIPSILSSHPSSNQKLVISVISFSRLGKLMQSLIFILVEASIDCSAEFNCQFALTTDVWVQINTMVNRFCNGKIGNCNRIITLIWPTLCGFSFNFLSLDEISSILSSHLSSNQTFQPPWQTYAESDFHFGRGFHCSAEFNCLLVDNPGLRQSIRQEGNQ